MLGRSCESADQATSSRAGLRFCDKIVKTLSTAALDSRAPRPYAVARRLHRSMSVTRCDRSDVPVFPASPQDKTTKLKRTDTAHNPTCDTPLPNPAFPPILATPYWSDASGAMRLSTAPRSS